MSDPDFEVWGPLIKSETRHIQGVTMRTRSAALILCGVVTVLVFYRTQGSFCAAPEAAAGKRWEYGELRWEFQDGSGHYLWTERSSDAFTGQMEGKSSEEMCKNLKAEPSAKGDVAVLDTLGSRGWELVMTGEYETKGGFRRHWTFKRQH